MRFFVSVFSFLLISISGLAQDNSVEYLSNTLIIKFKDAQEVTKYKSKSIPEASIFSQYNIGEMNSIWKDEFTDRIRMNMQRKGKIVSLPSFDHLKNIFEVSFGSDVDALALSKEISKLPGIEYAEPKFIYKTDEITNDPIVNSTINFHHFDEAWEISKSSSDVIIAIVDSGVNYNHEDLKDKHWVNEDEIPNNGIDDDNNGFVDDYLGWDFWDSTGSNGELVQDNNPFGSYNPHGTHVAGIAAATPNNNLGLVGTGYNARFMAIKAGGIADDPTTEDDESRSIAGGYQGILYAVVNGADIINCSWGGSGFSSFGLDVIDIATEAGALVVSSAGNSSTSAPGYPSAFEDVLSVGALGTSGDAIASYSNYGSTVDVFATGTIRSSVGTTSNEYATFQGTSMASPAVAGLAALIKSEHPDWDPERIKSQIRASSESIEASNNPDLQFLLGKGKVNAERALSDALPGIRVDSAVFLNNDGEKLNINEDGFLKLFITNDGGSVNSLSLIIESLSENANIENSAFSIDILGTNETQSVNIPITLGPGILQTLRAEFFIQFADNSIGYSDFKIISFDQLKFNISSGNNLAISFSPTGNIGFYDAANAEGGIGFIPNPETANFVDDNLIYEGGLLFSANELLANTVRTSDGRTDRNFGPISLYSVTQPGTISEADGNAIFVPLEQTLLQDAEITLNTYAFDSPNLTNAVVMNYMVENKSLSLSFSDVYLGIFNDWDIGEFSNNSTSYNEENDILIITEEGESEHPYVALATYGNTSSVLAIDNQYDGNESDFEFNISDGFSFQEKINTLKAGTGKTNITGTDVSSVVASGPYFIEPGNTISIGFVYAFGDTEQELIDQINAARNLGIFDLSESNSDPDNSFPESVSFFQNYPNPFNPSTTIRFNLDKRVDVELSIYNILGQKVRTIINSRLQGGIHNYTVSLNEFSSGLYFAVLQTPDTREIIKLTLIK
tara:strand:+ start:10212 stop:13097 length:2886 start_codon:yes stop_codon:yes gene_type:complete